MKVSEVLEKALELLGPNGEHWVNCCPISTGDFCAITAIWKAERKNPLRVCDAIRKGAGIDRSIFLSAWNDSSTFPEVKAAFEKAIALARQEESLDASGK